MTNLYKHKQIKSVLINKEYSLSGELFIIPLNPEGINIKLSDLKTILEISNYQDKLLTLVDYYPQFFSSLKIKDASVLNYEYMLGEKKSKEYYNHIKSFIKVAKKVLTTYHLELFKIRKEAYLNLNPVYYSGDLLDKPNYNHKSTTGRTSITSGFNFLTMKKSERKKLKPFNPNNVLVEIDFKSCEPFFYLKSLGIIKEDIKDVYHHIANIIGVEIKDRDAFKRGVLSLIYGANENTLSKIMRLDYKTVIKIKEYFQIDSFKSKLEKKFEENNHVFNFYGRPIFSNSNLVNYWIQSSSVDYCTFAFNRFIKEYNVMPCFFIHDSLTFETTKEIYDTIKNKKYITDPYSKINIPVTFNIYD